MVLQLYDGDSVAQFIPVYRLHQPTLVSPCLLGNLCPTCTLHQKCIAGSYCYHCRRGKPFACERQTPAIPAFTVGVAEALRLVHNREATFIHQNTALQLTFARLTHLRDQSCKVDPEVIFQYAAGSRRARIAVDVGWQGAPAISVLVASRQRSARLGFV
jgi:hypothetical protein